MAMPDSHGSLIKYYDTILQFSNLIIFKCSGFSTKVTCALLYCRKKYSNKGLNCALSAFYGGSLEIRLTVPLNKEYIPIHPFSSYWHGSYFQKTVYCTAKFNVLLYRTGCWS